MEPSVAFQPPPDAQQPSLPAPFWRIILFGCLALAAGVGLAWLAISPNVSTYPGTLSARIVPVTADRTGVISEWHVAEGDEVTIGQPLASMADPTIERRRLEVALDIARLQAELDRALAKADLDLDWRMKDVNETIFTARLQAAEYLEEKHHHDMEKVALTDLLTRDSTAFWTQPDTMIDSIVLKDSDTESLRLNSPSLRLNTVLRLEAATNSSEVCDAQVDLCDEQVGWLEGLKETLPARVRKSVGVDIAERNLEQAQAEQDELAEAETRTAITSSAVGRAGVFFKRVGDYVAVGEPIVEVLDESQRFVILDVPSENVAEFSIGRELTVVFPGDVKRQGRVVRVAPQAVRRGDDAATASVVRVHIEQAGIVWPSVPIGARVDASL